MRVKAIRSVERRGASGCMDLIVVGKLSQRKPGRPVIMERVNVGSQNLFNCAVGAFSLTVSLRMMRGRDVELGLES